MVNVFGQMDECEGIQATPFKNPDQEPDPELGEVKIEEDKSIKSNVTANNSLSNATKVNCLTDKVYGPVEVRY